MAQSSRKAKAAPGTSSTSRRGRPTADRALAIDAGIRAAALDLFLDAGFEATSMDAIAARAPVSKGTLYARYENKQQLFRAVMEDELERMSEEAGANDHLLPPELAPRLRYHARTLFETYNRPRFRAFGLLIDSALRTFPELEADWQELGTGRYLRFLADDIGKATDAQGLPLEDRDFLANLFLHSITGHHRSEAGWRPSSEVETLAFTDRVIETILLVIGQRIRR